MGFIVYALPRSRTAWTAEFLNYADCICGHEQAIYLRSIADIKDTFRRPNMGSVETAAAQGWRILHHHVPDLAVAVIRRPIDEVVASMLAIDLRGEFRYDEAKLHKIMEYGDRMLQQVSDLPGTLTIPYTDLVREDACAALFEHCLPYEFDRGWWAWMKDRNIQVDVVAVLRYYHENKADVDGFKSLCRRELRRLARIGALRKETVDAVD